MITRRTLFKKLANFYTAFQKEYYESYSFIQRIRKQYDDEELNIISEILHDGKDNFEMVIEDVSITALAILIAIKGFEYSWTVESDDNKTNLHIECLLDVIFNGLNKR